MTEGEVEEMAALFKSISHPIRLQILCLLQDGELTVGEIRKSVKTSGANISQHLNILRNQGVVGRRRDANFIYNHIADERVVLLMNSLREIFCAEDTGSEQK